MALDGYGLVVIGLDAFDDSLVVLVFHIVVGNIGTWTTFWDGRWRGGS